MEFLSDPQIWITLLTLTILEIVLGIDNIIFISILSGKLPAEEQSKARSLGLAFAMISRVALLFSISWVMKLTHPLFEIVHRSISIRDLILIGGGLFLIAKSTHEIHEKLEGDPDHASGQKRKKISFSSVIIQIIILDIVFSLDSVITAIGMSNHLPVMIVSVMLAVGVMLFFSSAVSEFVHNHPTVKILALSFLLLIGVTLIAEGCHQHISKGYIYFAMTFSVFVEFLNLRIKKKEMPPVELRGPSIS